MKVHIYGNSLIRSVNLHDIADITIIPGAKLATLVTAALNRPSIRNCLLYLIEGPIRYSKLIRTQNRREMVPEIGVREIIPQLDEIRRRCSRRNITVVIPTMSSMHYAIHNKFVSQLRGTRLIMNSFYQEYQDTLCDQICNDNGYIVKNNREWGVHTPFLNKCTAMSRKRFSYGRRKLYDGLHPHYSLRRVWEKELKKNIRLNRARLRSEIFWGSQKFGPTGHCMACPKHIILSYSTLEIFVLF